MSTFVGSLVTDVILGKADLAFQEPAQHRAIFLGSKHLEEPTVSAHSPEGARQLPGC